MFFTFAVYSIILAIGSEVDSLERGSGTSPSSSGAESSPQHDNHYFSTFPGYTLSSQPYSTLTTKANTLPGDSTATTGRQSDLDHSSRPDEYNHRSTFARSAELHEVCLNSLHLRDSHPCKGSKDARMLEKLHLFDPIPILSSPIILSEFLRDFLIIPTKSW